MHTVLDHFMTIHMAPGWLLRPSYEHVVEWELRLTFAGLSPFREHRRPLNAYFQRELHMRELRCSKERDLSNRSNTNLNRAQNLLGQYFPCSCVHNFGAHPFTFKTYWSMLDLPLRTRSSQFYPTLKSSEIYSFSCLLATKRMQIPQILWSVACMSSHNTARDAGRSGSYLRGTATATVVV